MIDQAPDPATTSARNWSGGLAARLLALTIAFVMLAEVAIYIPSIANFRNNWLRDRLSAAYTAALVLEAAPPESIPESLTRDLLASVGAMTIALKRADARRLLAISDAPPRIDERFDLRAATPWRSIVGAFATLLGSDARMTLVVGDAPMGAEFIEITLPAAPLRSAMWAYSINVLLLSLMISGIVAGLAVLALHWLVVRPVRRLTSSLIAFSEAPEDGSRIIKPDGGRHEIGRAQEALEIMQRRLLAELQQKKHLAALGLAVAKISHDLRGMLATAQLLSDRLADSPDGTARGVGPKLVSTLDRAISFCQSTLAYGRAIEPAPRKSAVLLHDLLHEAIESAAPLGEVRARIVNEAPVDLRIEADEEQMFRVFVNLLRNSLDALATGGPQPGREPMIFVRAHKAGGRAIIEVSDTGPGLAPRAREKLFVAFQGSNRVGGSGLGLAIAAELVEAHGGTIRLLEEGREGGASFVIELPQDGASPT